MITSISNKTVKALLISLFVLIKLFLVFILTLHLEGRSIQQTPTNIDKWLEPEYEIIISLVFYNKNYATYSYNSEALFSQAIAYREERCFLPFIEIMNFIIKKDPKNLENYTSRAYYELGKHYYNTKEKKAISLIEKSLDIDPGLIKSIFFLQHLYESENKYEKIIYYLERYEKEVALYDEITFMLMDLYDKTNQNEKFKDLFFELSMLYEDDPRITFYKKRT